LCHPFGVIRPNDFDGDCPALSVVRGLTRRQHRVARAFAPNLFGGR
jgi:hypothetical protein